MTPFPLHKSQRNTKILITLFLFSMIAAFAVAALNVYDKVGRTRNGAAHRYGPEAPPAQVQESVHLSDDDLPLENDPGSGSLSAEPLAARMNTFSALVDITHPHIFQIPILLFVLAHFLMRTRVAEWLKLTNYLMSFGGMLAFIAAPWLVRYWSTELTPLLYVGATAMGVSVLLMTSIPIWDMWRGDATDRITDVRVDSRERAATALSIPASQDPA